MESRTFGRLLSDHKAMPTQAAVSYGILVEQNKRPFFVGACQVNYLFVVGGHRASMKRKLHTQQSNVMMVANGFLDALRRILGSLIPLPTPVPVPIPIRIDR